VCKVTARVLCGEREVLRSPEESHERESVRPRAPRLVVYARSRVLIRKEFALALAVELAYAIKSRKI
jgi:hypothetical protein